MPDIGKQFTEIDLTHSTPHVHQMMNEYWNAADWKAFTTRHPHIVTDDAQVRTSRRFTQSQERTPGTEAHAASQTQKQGRYAQRRAVRKAGKDPAVQDWLKSLGS